jgi:hypothetical protein
VGAQALDCLVYDRIDLPAQNEHEGQGLDVTVSDAACEARRMRRTNALYSSFSTCRRGRFGVNLALTVSGLGDGALVTPW